MDNLEILIAQHEKELEEHGRRLSQLEKDRDAAADTARAVAVITERLNTVIDKIDVLTTKVDVIEAKPGKRWDSIITAIISAIIGIIIGWVFTR